MQASNSSAAVRPRSGRLPLLDHRHRVVHDPGQLALVDPAGAAVEVLVAELAVLEVLDQPALVDLEVHRGQPGAQQRQRVLRAEVALRLAGADVALAHHALDDLEHRGRVGSARRLAVTERADRERHRRVGPLGGAALVAVRHGCVAARMCARNSRGRRATGVSVKVRPMSIPAWSSVPPMPVPPWVSM